MLLSLGQGAKHFVLPLLPHRLQPLSGVRGEDDTFGQLLAGYRVGDVQLVMLGRNISAGAFPDTDVAA